MEGFLAMACCLSCAKAAVCMLQFLALGGIERAQDMLMWAALGFIALEAAGHK